VDEVQFVPEQRWMKFSSFPRTKGGGMKTEANNTSQQKRSQKSRSHNKPATQKPQHNPTTKTKKRKSDKYYYNYYQ